MGKKKQPDPHAAREAANYDNPIASRELILELLAQRGAPASRKVLGQELGLSDPDAIEALRRRLIAMTRDGQVICNRRGEYAPVASIDLLKGHVVGHRDGFGFFVPEQGGGDLFLSARQMRMVFPGDKVLVRRDGYDGRGKESGVIVDVLEHCTSTVVGRLYRESGVAYVMAEVGRQTVEVSIPEDACMGAVHGQYVSAEITRQPTLRTRAMGRVIEVLGDHLAPGMEIDVAIRSHGIPFVWPAEVEQAVAALRSTVADKDKKGRVDLRHLPLVTIDGEDARDFDDAVYCEAKKSGGWRLYVAIADVSHYVRPGSPLDEEALNRGTSVYFPDHVVPMLPEILSNGLCSLNPKVDRLCMVCEMTVSVRGRVSGYRFYEGVMHSAARLTYTQVGAMLEEPESELGIQASCDYAEILPHLHALYQLYQALSVAREERGAIDFETVETRILFDENRKIDAIVPRQRNVAHRIIEECMLCANVSAANLLIKAELPALYRIHQGPKPQKLENLRLFLGELGLQLMGGEQPTPQDYQNLLQQIKDRPDFNVIQTVMLRSMSQAVYGPEKEGHFGLGYEHYTHFTSPIRRYPDLLVHRGIKALIYRRDDDKSSLKSVFRPEGVKPGQHQYPYQLADMVQFGEHCSMTERRADDATRDVDSWLKCEYLQQHIGECFEGVIASVTGFGFFVELDGLFVEGLVHISTLGGDYYHFEAAKHRLIGERTRRCYQLGDEVSVQVTRIDLDDRKVDFALLEQKSRAAQKKKKAASRRARNKQESGKDQVAAKAENIGKTGKKRGRDRRKMLEDYAAEQSKAGKPNTDRPGADKKRPDEELARPRKRKTSTAKKSVKAETTAKSSGKKSAVKTGITTKSPAKKRASGKSPSKKSSSKKRVSKDGKVKS